MSYYYYITRKNNWYDDEGEEISSKEWHDAVDSEKDMRFEVPAETSGLPPSVKLDDYAVWFSHPQKIETWFYLCAGSIELKNPDKEMLAKFSILATKLKAKVQGEDEGEVDGEVFEENQVGRESWFKRLVSKFAGP